MKQSLNHLLPYLEVVLLIACTGLWLSVPFKKKNMIQAGVSSQLTQEKKALQWRMPFWIQTLDFSYSGTQAWPLEHRDPFLRWNPTLSPKLSLFFSSYAISSQKTTPSGAYFQFQFFPWLSCVSFPLYPSLSDFGFETLTVQLPEKFLFLLCIFCLNFRDIL